MSAAPDAAPDAYVVRIYRRSARHPARAAGTVERVADGSVQGFRSLAQLALILARRSDAKSGS